MEDISESNDENLDENIVEAFEQNTESCGDDATSKPEPIASYISIMLNIINNIISISKDASLEFLICGYLALKDPVLK